MVHVIIITKELLTGWEISSERCRGDEGGVDDITQKTHARDPDD